MKLRDAIALGLFVSQTTYWSGTTMAATDNDERRSTLADQTAVAVTIYYEGLALVKDRRRRPGRSRLPGRQREDQA